MRFAWQGFELHHHEDWAPASLSGTRNDGYVRIASPESLSLQIRWTSKVKPRGELANAGSYLERLRRDSKKSKRSFTSHIEEAEDLVYYRWQGDGNGSGVVLDRSGRRFFLEVSALNNRSTSSQFRKVFDSFCVPESRGELWSVFGLNVRLPEKLDLAKSLFQSGRTRLEWRGREADVVAERWGLADQIMKRHHFADWAEDCLQMRLAEVAESEQGLELRLLSRKNTWAIAKPLFDRNQIILVKASAKDTFWRPTWDWLN